MDDKTRDVLDALFSFKIGELVYFRTAAGGILGREHPTMFQIMARHFEQCPGGIQQSYTIGGRVYQELELTRDLPIGRKLTEVEAQGIRDYMEKTRTTTNWSDIPSWLPETKKDADDDG